MLLLPVKLGVETKTWYIVWWKNGIPWQKQKNGFPLQKDYEHYEIKPRGLDSTCCHHNHPYDHENQGGNIALWQLHKIKSFQYLKRKLWIIQTRPLTPQTKVLVQDTRWRQVKAATPSGGRCWYFGLLSHCSRLQHGLLACRMCSQRREG